MTADEFLKKSLFEDSHEYKCFPSSMKKQEVIDLMEDYAKAQATDDRVASVVGQREQLSDEPEYCNKHKWNDCECTDICRRGLSIT